MSMHVGPAFVKRSSFFSNSASKSNSFDPEAGLALSASLPPNSVISASNLARNAPAVFAADFSGLDGSSGGLIADFGGAVNGAYCGFRSNGDFIVRCGDGSKAGPPFANDKVGFVLNDQGVVQGDGTLVVEFVPGTPILCRAWWNGKELPNAHSGAGGYSNWSGTNNGGYLGIYGNSYVMGELTTVVNYTTASDVRYYANQTVKG